VLLLLYLGPTANHSCIPIGYLIYLLVDGYQGLCVFWCLHSWCWWDMKRHQEIPWQYRYRWKSLWICPWDLLFHWLSFSFLVKSIEDYSPCQDIWIVRHQMNEILLCIDFNNYRRGLSILNAMDLNHPCWRTWAVHKVMCRPVFFRFSYLEYGKRLDCNSK